MAITISGDSPNFSAATITTVTSTTLSDGTNSTSSTNCIQGSAKAWVNYNGSSQSIRASYNVSSVTYNSAANYTINFTNAFSDANYMTAFGTQCDYNSSAVVNWVGISSNSGTNTNKTTTSITLQAKLQNGGTTTNGSEIHMVCLR